MRLRLGSSRDGEASVVVLDPASGLWVPLVDAVKGGGRGERSKWPHGDGPLRDVTAFLGLGREKRRAAAAVVAAAAATCGGREPPADRVPLDVASFRDAALYVAHMAQASKGFFPVALSCGHAVQLVLQNILGKALRLPRVLGPCGVPPFYVGNPRTIVRPARSRWPSYAEKGDSTSYVGWLDYELEVALINGATLGDDPSEAACEEAILEYGGFVLINDFSARDVQADEMASVGFGFVKCKSFCTAMGSDVVTADELWMHTDMGKMFCGEGLKCEVRVNGEPGARRATRRRRCCLLSDYVKHVALGEGLHPGGVGPRHGPGLLRPRDRRVAQAGRRGHGGLRGPGHGGEHDPAPVAGPNFRDLGRAEHQPGRLASAWTFLKLAFLGPPLVFAAMVGGFLGALLWAGPKTPPGLAGVAVGPGRAAAKDWDGAPGADNSGVAKSAIIDKTTLAKAD
ncbi:Fumarylacetoacetate (FAA) hydrolase-like protein [Aureococcus anophagefferens]|nr:Fumarylacetoacetate (FAA) hydrolase-like protein [Aureococcus anophagefferens]